MTDDKLIRDLESGPSSRKLSDRVLLACGWTTKPYMEGKQRVVLWLAPDGIRSYKNSRPNPIRNLQDAVDWVVPEGWQIQMISNQPGWTVCVRSPDARYKTSGPNQGGTYEDYLVQGIDASAIQCPTAALALCIASEKARAALRAREERNE